MKHHYFYRAEFKVKPNRESIVTGVLALDSRLLTDNGSWPRFIEAVAKEIIADGYDLSDVPNIIAVSFLHATDDE
jgi:hypothetical protein